MSKSEVLGTLFPRPFRSGDALDPVRFLEIQPFLPLRNGVTGCVTYCVRFPNFLVCNAVFGVLIFGVFDFLKLMLQNGVIGQKRLDPVTPLYAVLELKTALQISK